MFSDSNKASSSGFRISIFTQNLVFRRENFTGSGIPANTVRNITLVKVPYSSFMDERNEDVLTT